ncbi:MAG: segregation and condensation protein [Actinomycetota bacterium]|jgi:segregation and condensation protein A|nr:segregation and condensation protein [Actinomycetota bacterium]
MPYEVSTDVYEGPFDLLLHLIARHEVDLYEISLSAIVDAYLAELDRMGPLDLDVATEFLVIAATLVELKSRRLLPGSTEDVLEDDLALYEERDLLLARLLECKTFSGAGSALGRMIDAGARSSPRTAGPGPQFLALAPDLLAGVTPADLHAALERAATPKPVPRVDLFHVAPLRISVADAVDELWAMLPSAGTTTFRAITEGVPAGLEVVVRFLAILEMYKQGLIELEQATTFGELSIVWLGEEEAVGVGVDSYGD